MEANGQNIFNNFRTLYRTLTILPTTVQSH